MSYILRGLDSRGNEYFYTGRAGSGWVSTNESDAFSYPTKSQAQNKAKLFNGRVAITDLWFVVKNARQINTSYRKIKKEVRKLQRAAAAGDFEGLEPGPMFQKWRKYEGISKTGKPRRPRKNPHWENFGIYYSAQDAKRQAKYLEDNGNGEVVTKIKKYQGFWIVYAKRKPQKNPPLGKWIPARKVKITKSGVQILR